MFSTITSSVTTGSARTLIGIEEFAQLKASGTVVIDERRRRTKWYDGRFLSAQDQTREQEYVLKRFADIGRSSGMGVVHGLQVNGSTPFAITIGPGQGITPSGELVLVPQTTEVNLADIAAIEQIDAAFGLSRIPRVPAMNRSGLFVLGLRPVEYTANPISSYPTTIQGQRTTQDGDIIEAAALVLIPYVDDATRRESLERRSQVARRIFFEEGPLGVPGNVLPLAMIALDRGVIQWLDAFMVRREVGAEHGSILSLGFSPRALREAYALQYFAQLAEIMGQRNASNRGQRFAATEYFQALPPAGIMPTAAIDPSDFSQIFFPSQIQADLSLIPDDEIAALVEESLLLPPIDLTASAEHLEATSVLVLAPVPRAQILTLEATLTSLVSTLHPAAPGIIFQQKPIQSLLALTAARFAAPLVNAQSIADAAWRQVLNRSPLLWFVRRRNLQVRVDLTGAPVPASSDQFTIKKAMAMYDQLAARALTARFAALRNKATTQAMEVIGALLSSPLFIASPLFMEAALLEFEAIDKPDQLGTLAIAARYAYPHVGEGIEQMVSVNAQMQTPGIVARIASSGFVPEIDRVARSLTGAALEDFTQQVFQLAVSNPDMRAKLADILKRRGQL